MASNEDSKTARRFIIEGSSPTGRAGLPTLIDRLKVAGVDVDPSYRPVLVDPKRHRYALRGEATPDARERAQLNDDLAFYADDPIEPV